MGYPIRLPPWRENALAARLAAFTIIVVMRFQFSFLLNRAVLLVLCTLVPVAAFSKNEALREAIAAIQKVGPEGAGNAAAAQAWQTIQEQDAAAIMVLLRSMESSSPLARNWLRSALEVIFSRSLKEAPDSVPVDDLESFLFDLSQSSPARKLAFDLIAQIEPGRANKLQSKFAADPSPELRRGSVALLIANAKSLLSDGKNEEAVAALGEALNAAREVDQIKEIASLLKDKAKQEVDLPRHFGFLMYWNVIGPFDNTDRSGFAAEFDPEKEIQLDASYDGKTKQVTWKPYFTTDDYGMVDFNQPYDPIKEVTAYAYTEFQSDAERSAELRLGCKNAWKIWLNGEFVFGRDEYHRGIRIDQYKMPVQLRKGKNTILVKACQDAQEQSWTKEWQFQLRICDSTGTAILATDRKPTPEKNQPVRRRPRPGQKKSD